MPQQISEHIQNPCFGPLALTSALLRAKERPDTGSKGAVDSVDAKFAGIFRPRSHPRLPAVFGCVDSAERSPANRLKIAPVINDNNGVMLLWCIGDEVHR